MITLTLPKQSNDDGTEIPGGSFGWFRGQEGEHNLEGNWQTLSQVGGLPPGVICHFELQKALTEIALSRGLNDGHKFAKNIQPPKKEKKERTPKDPSEKSPRKPSPGLMGGFNPFAKPSA